MVITFTQTDLDNLKEALVSGVMEVQVQGRTIKYRSYQEMINLIALIEQQLSGSTTDPETDFVVGGFDRRNEDDE